MGLIVSGGVTTNNRVYDNGVVGIRVGGPACIEGNRFDGDGDGVAGADYVRTFRIHQNSAPVLTAVPTAATIPELRPYTFDADATDADLPAQTLTFSLLGGPSGATIDVTTGVFLWTPTEAQGPGDYTFTVRVSDGLANTDQLVTLHVTEVNEGSLDVDGNGAADALTDGILILRYLFDPLGAWNYSDALGSGAARTTRTAIRAYLNQYNPALTPGQTSLLVQTADLTGGEAISTCISTSGDDVFDSAATPQESDTSGSSVVPATDAAVAAEEPLLVTEATGSGAWCGVANTFDEDYVSVALAAAAKEPAPGSECATLSPMAADGLLAAPASAALSAETDGYAGVLRSDTTSLHRIGEWHAFDKAGVNRAPGRRRREPPHARRGLPPVGRLGVLRGVASRSAGWVGQSRGQRHVG